MANISLATAEKLDGYIAALLGFDGLYRIPGGGSLEFLRPTARNRDFVDRLNLLSSRAGSGNGWINHGRGLAEVRMAPTHGHAYSSVAHLPHWAGVAPALHTMDETALNDFDIPILTSIRAALGAGTRNIANMLSSMVGLRVNAYRSFLLKLNGYINSFTHTAFRMPDFVMNAQPRTFDPLYFTIRPRTFVALWKFPLVALKPSIALTRLPEIESRMDAEIQVFSVVLNNIF